MATGASFELEEQAGGGVVRYRLVPRENIEGQGRDEPEDMDYAVTLSSAFPASHDHAIVADRPIRVLAGGAIFTKFAIDIITNHQAFIAFDKRVSSNPGDYHRRHPGSARLEDRTKGAREMWIVFPVVPPDPVEVVLYAGEPARPT